MKKIIFYGSLLIGLCVIFVMNFNHVIDGIEADAQEQELLINQFDSRMNNISDVLRVYAEDYFENGASYDSEYIEYFVYDEELEMYILEYPGPIPYDGVSLTGLEEIPADGIARQELNMALSIGRLFSLYYETVPGLTWMFYTSESGYMALYPWASTDEFVYDADNPEDYYTAATPENNPTGEKVWIPLYEDYAGKGYLFTLSQPVYYNGDFLGVVSVEFSNGVFDSRITTDYGCYIINEYDQILGTNDENLPEGIVTVNDYFGASYEEIAVEVEEGSGGVIASGQYVYTLDVDTDYFCGLVVVPISQILAETLSRTLVFVLLALIIILIYRAFENRKKSLEELARMSVTDPLTGIYNRRKFEETVYKKVESRDFNRSYVALMDLDHFKRVNDNFGHDVGDEVLKVFAELLKVNLDEYFEANRLIYGRIGGEEFGIIFEDFAGEEVIKICETIREGVEALDFGNDLKITVSCGISKVTSGTSYSETCKKADAMLYKAKDTGRNKVLYDI